MCVMECLEGGGDSALSRSDFRGIYVDECFFGVRAGEEFEGFVISIFQGGFDCVVTCRPEE